MLLKTKLVCRLAIVAIAACFTLPSRDCAAQGLEQMLIGNWELDVAATKKLGGKSAEQFAKLGDFDVSVQFDFRQDGVLAMNVPGAGDIPNDLQKWTVTKEDPKTKQLTIEVHSGGAKSEGTIILEFVDAKRVKATTVKKEGEPAAPWVMRRVAPKEKK